MSHPADPSNRTSRTASIVAIRLTFRSTRARLKYSVRHGFGDGADGEQPQQRRAVVDVVPNSDSTRPGTARQHRDRGQDE